MYLVQKLPSVNCVFCQIPALIGCLLGVPVLVHAQSSSSGAVGADDAQVIGTWRAGNPGAPVPVLVTEAQGTRVEWTGGVSVDQYANRITSASGFSGTGLQSGSYYKAMTQNDLRVSPVGGPTDYFQIATTHSDDLSVARQSHAQIGSLQFGRSGADYLVAAGDVVPNFSSLSSALNVRGFVGQLHFGGASVNAYSGQVAESWEALRNPTLRLLPLRTVNGLKVEAALSDFFRGYVTSQYSHERSLGSPLGGAISEGESFTTHSAGFHYQKGGITLSGEVASSAKDRGDAESRTGSALVLDVGWQEGGNSLRSGLHVIDPEYRSLSHAARAGVREAYVTVQKALSPQVSAGVDLRQSRLTTLGGALAVPTATDTDAVALNLQWNPGPDFPGWTGSLQHSRAIAHTSESHSQVNRDASMSVNYASPLWSASLTYGEGVLRYSLWPDYNSVTTNVYGSFRRVVQASEVAGGWAGVWGGGFRRQKQKLAAGSGVTSTEVSLQALVERADWGSASLAVVQSSLEQGDGAQPVRSRSLQFDMTYFLGKKVSLRVYLRNAQLNYNKPLSAVAEKSAGVQMNMSY